MNELQCLREKIDNEGAKAVVDKLVFLKQSLKVPHYLSSSYLCLYFELRLFCVMGFDC